MQLRILLPNKILTETTVKKVSLEGIEGAITLLPRHIDYVTVIVPGLLTFITEDGNERFLAVDSGMMVKKGETINVSVRNAVFGDSLQNLRETVQQQFKVLEEHEQQARAVLTSLETDLVRRFIDLGRERAY